MKFKRGDQIAYIPDHADSIQHKDVQFGFVTSGPNSSGAYFCRYWREEKSPELRTKANSEATPYDHLVLYKSHTEKEVEQALKEFC